jgi:hypothetical protein
MHSYPHISHVLRTAFNVEDGLSPKVSKSLYLRMMFSSPYFDDFKQELDAAFADPDMSWKTMLCNDSYEVFDASTEQQAREVATEMLLTPLAMIKVHVDPSGA